MRLRRRSAADVATTVGAEHAQAPSVRAELTSGGEGFVVGGGLGGGAGLGGDVVLRLGGRHPGSRLRGRLSDLPTDGAASLRVENTEAGRIRTKPAVAGIEELR